eukprot:gene21-30_t
MAEVIKMPKMSDTMVEGVIATWLKKVGDTVRSGDVIAEVETDKATMELEVYTSGTLLYVDVAEKQAVPINGLLAIIGKADENITALLEELKEVPHASTSHEPAPSAPATPPTPSPSLPSITAAAIPQRLLISPLAKKMAQDQGHDIATIKGTGENGRIIKRDIIQLANQQPVVHHATSVVHSFQEGWEDLPISSMRNTIAKRLTESKNIAPHFYLTVSIHMDAVVAARTQLNQHAPVKITFNDMVMKAVASAIKQHPQVNTAWMGNTIRYNKHIHLGVAIAVEAGLLVPVIRFADQKSLSQIAAEVKTLTQKAHSNQLQPADWAGGTFTLSNLGMLGVESFTAILNPPAACILAVGAIQQQPIVKEGAVVPGHVMKVTLSCDHRVVDGAVGASFLATLKALLEEPLSSTMIEIKSTTVIAVMHNNQVAIGADGQATIGNTVAKERVNKIRKLFGGKVVTGFAGSTADAFTLLDRFDEKLQKYSGNMKRSAIELAKDWRTDRYLRRLEAMLIAATPEELLLISGTGDVLEPDNGIISIGSGSLYAQSAAIALTKHAPHLTAEDIVRESLTIAADTCIYTNHNLTIEKLYE